MRKVWNVLEYIYSQTIRMYYGVILIIYLIIYKSMLLKKFMFYYFINACVENIVSVHFNPHFVHLRQLNIRL